MASRTMNEQAQTSSHHAEMAALTSHGALPAGDLFHNNAKNLFSQHSRRLTSCGFMDPSFLDKLGLEID